MLVSEIIADCGQRINDVSKDEVQDAEWIKYINQSIDQLSRQLIGAKDAEMITETYVSNGSSVFSNFEKLVGSYPNVYISAGVFRITGAGTPVTVRYYGTKPHVLDVSNQIPFKDSYCELLAQMAARFAKERIGKQIADSTTLLNEQVSVVNGAKA